MSIISMISVMFTFLRSIDLCITVKANSHICDHCGDNCYSEVISFENKSFCCHGCLNVFKILDENNLSQFYDINDRPGIKPNSKNDDKFIFLENKEVQNKYLIFQSAKLSVFKVFLPEIHCSSCILLLENMNRLLKGVVSSEVNFIKKEATIQFDPSQTTLKEIALMLNELGYPPDFHLNEEGKNSTRHHKKLISQLAIAGFCFGNIMLLSFPEYLNPDKFFISQYRLFFSVIILILSIPLLLYSGFDYLKSAYSAIKHGQLNIDIPISLGICVLYLKSTSDIVLENGPGYMDSFAGFIFFLLIGKWFQFKTYDYLSFDRDYSSYFPVAIKRIKKNESEVVQIEKLEPGDRIHIHHEEVLPVDSLLLSDQATINYSFVTGESQAISVKQGELIYAGGINLGAIIELDVKSKVDQSHLVQLWNNNDSKDNKNNSSIYNESKLTKTFIIVLLIVASISALFWSFKSMEKVPEIITAVLIVACPCAIALSRPFTLGNTMRTLSKKGLFLQNSETVENMAQITDIVFDKTGTLTSAQSNSVLFSGQLSTYQKELIKSIVHNSKHPLSVSISSLLSISKIYPVLNYKEHVGQGIEGEVNGNLIKVGAASFVGAITNHSESCVFIQINGEQIGFYKFENTIREGIETELLKLSDKYSIHLLSGDNNSSARMFTDFFSADKINFNQSPIDKLNYIQNLEKKNKRVMMIGDGLNDAGALRISNVGISISEDIYGFSPSCDGILKASALSSLSQFLLLSKYAKKVLRRALFFSLVYNAVGLSFAISGDLTPLVAAIIMPLSSISIVVFTTLSIKFFEQKHLTD